MRRRPVLNIPTGTIRGSEEEKKQSKKVSKEEAISSYLQILEDSKRMRENRGNSRYPQD